ncbi:hypothetical protein PACTADRAFT_2356 [Pachysolen tannophilus NRRL Y-2460]|uniref:Efficient mitochondria targeting-associated protein 19 n=1 Tax=Pachysolen tannophilus NRRL Y-2460 TaxID=669874 RepID=A0A1E4TWE8_PACTA|nr:hypothetical protein PACTADRAFT_2356 [Pachysolen tannophilus NRRL Y-2460]
MSSQQFLDRFYFLYYLIHIPITVLIDSTLVIPKEFQLELQKTILSFHISSNNDFLLAGDVELWLKIFGLIEILFQLPFFIYYCITFLKKKFSVTVTPNPKLYVCNLIYGFNASLTTLVCLFYVYFKGPENGLTNGEVINLIFVYFPTFLIPAIIFIDFTKRITNLLQMEFLKSKKNE